MKKAELRDLSFENAVNMLIGGYTTLDGDMERALELIRNVLHDFEKEIEKK